MYIHEAGGFSLSIKKSLGKVEEDSRAILFFLDFFSVESFWAKLCVYVRWFYL